MYSNQRGDGRGYWGEWWGGFSGTTVKDTWTKPRGGGIRGGRWGWLGWGGQKRERQKTVLEQQ